MRHGAADKFILPAWGDATAAQLATLGFNVNADMVPGLAHDMADEEIQELTAWLIRILTGEVIA